MLSGVKNRPTALLALADGTIFPGFSIGADGAVLGEVVFNTAMTGYQEILTDPSYYQQIVTLTYPHIGNTGFNQEDMESKQVWAEGLILRDASLVASSWRSEQSLSDYLKSNNIVAIAGIDTRQLTRLLREKGAQNGCLMVGDDADKAVELASAFPGLSNQNLTLPVSVKQKQTLLAQEKKHRVVLLDYGVKQNIISCLLSRGCEVVQLPAAASLEQILAEKPDGVLLSNGPGDPAACTEIIAVVKQLIETDIPLFGICLGCQMLALALGARTKKMKFGHHGANHPVQDIFTQRVFITSQNHGFDIDVSSLPNNIEITHRSLFDQSIQGIRHQTKPIFAFQGHPEASPGPHDIASLFDDFIKRMEPR